MFDNIGERLKGLAKAVCWIGIICSVITGIVLFASSDRYVDYTLPGILIIVLGSLGCWIGSWALYGIGEAAANSKLIVRELIIQPGESVGKHDNHGKAIEGAENSNRIVKEPINQQEESVEKHADHGEATDNVVNSTENDVLLDGKYWRCARCGTINLESRTFCKGCGAKR